MTAAHGAPAETPKTLDPASAFGLIAATIGMFVWGRLPHGLAALSALLIGIGIVPEKHTFEGLADEIIVIIAADPTFRNDPPARALTARRQLRAPPSAPIAQR